MSLLAAPADLQIPREMEKIGKDRELEGVKFGGALSVFLENLPPGDYTRPYRS